MAGERAVWELGSTNLAHITWVTVYPLYVGWGFLQAKP